MKLTTKTTIAHVVLAVAKANEILANPAFYEAIAQLPQFDNTSLTSVEIADIFRNSTQEIVITTYWHKNIFRPRICVNATTGSATSIKINRRCFSKDLTRGVNTLIHESVHAADFAYKNARGLSKLSFTHVDNRNDGEEDNTAPWAIGALAEKFV